MKRKSLKVFVFGLAFMLGASMLTACSNQGSSNGDEDQGNNVVIQGKYIVNEKDDKYGLIDFDKKQIIANKYDYLGYLAAGDIFLAQKEGKWGIMDMAEKEIVPFKYEKLSLNYKNDKIFATDDKTTTVYSVEGKEQKTYDYGVAEESGEGTVIVGKDVSRVDYVITANYGLIDESGKEILKPEYSKMIYQTDYDIDTKTTKAISIYAEKDGKAGVFSLKGEVIIPMEYEAAIVLNDGSSMYNISYNGNTQSYYVKKGDVNRKGYSLYGKYDIKGKQIIETKYNHISGTDKGYIATLNEVDTVFDLEGNVLFSDPLVDVTALSENGYITATQSGNQSGETEYYFIDTEGNKVEIEALKDKGYVLNIGSFDTLGNADVRISTASGVEVALINEKGNFVIGPLQEEVNTMLNISKVDSYNENASFLSVSRGVQKNEFESTDYVVTLSEPNAGNVYHIVKSTLYNKEGEKLAELAGTINSSITGSLYQISIDKGNGITLYGLMDRSGNIVAEPIYNSIGNFYDDYMIASKGDAKYLLDKESGKIVLEY